MKVDINNVTYSVYWKHTNNGIGKKSYSQCIVTATTVVRNGQEIYTTYTGLSKTHPKDTYNRKVGMKVSFSDAVKQIDDKEVRTILWDLFMRRTQPTRPIYYYKGRPYALISMTKVKSIIGWQDAVIYEALYPNPDGRIWVRGASDFFSKFFTKSFEGVEEEIASVDENAPIENMGQETPEEIEEESIGFDPTQYTNIDTTITPSGEVQGDVVDRVEAPEIFETQTQETPENEQTENISQNNS